MRNVAIVGAGMTPFAEHFELGIKDLVPMAYAEAVANVDKGIQKSEIEAAWFGELSTTDGFPSGILADTLDLTDIPVTRIENACATGNDAIRNGTLAIASGLYDVVLVVGADKVRETSSNTTFWDWAAMTRDNAWDYPLGLVAPANFALHVMRYLHESPATKEHMAMVAVKNHFHAVKNPKAQLRYEITVEQALAAPIVVEPFGLYDCTPQSDGAAAVILAAEEVVDRYTDRPVWVRGVGLGMDRVMHQHKADMTTFPPTVRAAKAAMKRGKVGSLANQRLTLAVIAKAPRLQDRGAAQRTDGAHQAAGVLDRHEGRRSQTEIVQKRLFGQAVLGQRERSRAGAHRLEGR